MAACLDELHGNVPKLSWDAWLQPGTDAHRTQQQQLQRLQAIFGSPEQFAVALRPNQPANAALTCNGALCGDCGLLKVRVTYTVAAWLAWCRLTLLLLLPQLSTLRIRATSTHVTAKLSLMTHVDGFDRTHSPGVS